MLEKDNNNEHNQIYINFEGILQIIKKAKENEKRIYS